MASLRDTEDGINEAGWEKAMRQPSFKFVPQPDNVWTFSYGSLSMQRVSRQLRVLADGQWIGDIIEAPKQRWYALAPAGIRTEFTFPSRKQAAEWLTQTAR